MIAPELERIRLSLAVDDPLTVPAVALVYEDIYRNDLNPGASALEAAIEEITQDGQIYYGFMCVEQMCAVAGLIAPGRGSARSNEAVLSALVVDSAYRHKGIGSCALKQLETVVVADFNASVMKLVPFGESVPFYVRNGYTRYLRHPAYLSRTLADIVDNRDAYL